MFDFIREKKKILLVLLLLLVIPPFIVMGAWDRINPNSEPIVATINDLNITKRQWESVHQDFIDNLRQRIGGNISTDFFNTPETRLATLENLINKQLIALITAESRITVSEEMVKAIIRTIPEFQKDGVFNLKKAQDLLAKRGMTSTDFENRLRFDIASSIIPSLLTESSYVPRSVARKVAQAENEKRTFIIKLFSPLDYKNKISVSDSEVESYFSLNKSKFVLPARYDFDFITFNDPDQADSLANKLYEDAESLDIAAEEFGIEIKKIRSLDLNSPIIDNKLSNESLKIINNPLFRKSISTKEVLEDGFNSELVEINPKLFVSANLSGKKDEVPMKFELVKSQIKSEVLLEKMNTEAKKDANEWFEKYKSADKFLKTKLTNDKIDKITLKHNEPDANVGEFTEILSSRFQELFSHEFSINSSKLIDIGRNGAIVAILINSTIVDVSDKNVVNSLSSVYENMQRIESDSSLRLWLLNREKQMDVVRYEGQLESSSASKE